MPRLPPMLLAAALLLAGCVQTPGGNDPGGGAAPALAGYALDCGIASANASWPEPCLALASPNDSPSKTEVDLAVNPLDPLNVVVGSKDLDPLASDCVWSVVQVTKDGGRTWKTVIIGGEKASRAPGEPLHGWECVTDPIMAFDAEGALYYSLQAYDHTVEGADVPNPGGVLPGLTVGSSILMARSRDGGETWDKVITLHAGEGTVVFHDYMRIAVNPKTGSVYTIWNQFNTVPTPGPVPFGAGQVVPVLVASRDKGETAAAPVYIPVPGSATEGGAVMRGLAVDGEGVVFVLLQDGANQYLTVSADDARTFSAPVKVGSFVEVPRTMKNNTYRSGTHSELAVDVTGGARDGCLYASWASYENEDANVFSMTSCDGGETWSEPVQVNGGEFARGDQWMQRPWVDAKGNYHLVYVDKSRDENNTLMDVTWAVSTDGGLTFQNRRLTQAPFDPALGIHQDGFPFIGDYLGIGGVGDLVYMGFPTTATGRAEVAVAKVRAEE